MHPEYMKHITGKRKDARTDATIRVSRYSNGHSRIITTISYYLLEIKISCVDL
jgi:hypothetical protein